MAIIGTKFMLCLLTLFATAFGDYAAAVRKLRRIYILFVLVNNMGFTGHPVLCARYYMYICSMCVYVCVCEEVNMRRLTIVKTLLLRYKVNAVH